MKKRILKLECTWKTEWNRPFLKFLTFWSKSKLYLVKAFSFSFSFLQAARTGSGWTGQTGSAWENGSDHSGWWRHPWCHGACLRVRVFWRVTEDGGAWERVFIEAEISGPFGGAWLIVRACNFWVLWIGARWISWYCPFLKSQAYLRGIERLSREAFWARGCAWERMEIPWRMNFLGFVDRSPFKILVRSVS